MTKKVFLRTGILLASITLSIPFCTYSFCSCGNPSPQPDPELEHKISFANGWRLNYVYGGPQRRQFAPFGFNLLNFVGGEEIEFSIKSTTLNNDQKICFNNGSSVIRIKVKDNLDQLLVYIGLKDESMLSDMDALSFNLKASIYWGDKLLNELDFNDMWLIVGNPTTEDMFNITEQDGVKTLLGFKDDEETTKRIKNCNLLVIPIDVKNIASNAFCKSLSTTIPSSIEYLILDEYFGTRRSKLEYIGSGAFEKCNIDTVLFFPDSIKEIDNYAFSESKFSGEIHLPKSLITIGDKAFYKCTNFIGSLELPQYVNSIGNMAFAECTGFNKSLIFSETIADIHYATFRGCSGFKEIHFEMYQGIPIWISRDNNNDAFKDFADNGKVFVATFHEVWKEKLYSACSLPTNWLCFLSGSSDIPESYLNISSNGEELFGLKKDVDISWCNKLVIPVGVKVIKKDAFKGLFCAPYLSSIEIDLYNGTLLEIEDGAFSGCNSITGEIHLPNSFQKIGIKSFENCININAIYLPGTLLDIGDNAFVHCEKLNEINMDSYSFFPSWLTQEKENKIFQGIHQTGCIYVSNTIDIEKCWNLLSNNCGIQKRWNIFHKEKVVPVSSFDISGDGKILYGLADYRVLQDCDTILIPNGVETIWENAFSTEQLINSNIHNIVFNESLRNIGKNAFKNCTNFSCHICLPDSLTNIGEGAFENSGFGKYLYLPKNLTSIQTNAFNKCSNISEIDMTSYTNERPEWLDVNSNIFTFDITTNGGYVWFDDVLTAEEIKDWRLSLNVLKGLPYSWIATTKSRIVDQKYFILEDEGKTLAGVDWDSLTITNQDTLKIPEGVTKIKREAFSNSPLEAKVIKNIDLNNGSLLEIENRAFEKCSMEFYSLALPAGLQNVGSYAFAECYVERALCLKYIWNVDDHCFDGLYFSDTARPDDPKPMFVLDITDIDGLNLPIWYTKENSYIFAFKTKLDENGKVLYKGNTTALLKLQENIDKRTHLDINVWNDWKRCD